MVSVSEIFRAALAASLKDRWGGQTQLAKETGFSTGKINNLLTGARKSYEDDCRLIAEKLGYPGRRYENFLDIGRRALGLPVASKNGDPPPSPEVKELMDKTRKVAEMGGDKAAALRTMIESLLKG